MHQRKVESEFLRERDTGNLHRIEHTRFPTLYPGLFAVNQKGTLNQSRRQFGGEGARITIAIAIVAIVAWANPTLSLWLELDFAAVAGGQWWRVLTGHLTHYNGNHLFWDLLMFVVLGAAIERMHPRFFAAAIVAMSLGISLAIGWCCHEITVYRGLSGLDTGLFVWFVADQIGGCLRHRDRVAAILWLVPTVGLIAKLLFEYTTGQILFVDASTFTPLVESHLAGAAFGLLCSFWINKNSASIKEWTDAVANLLGWKRCLVD